MQPFTQLAYTTYHADPAWYTATEYVYDELCYAEAHINDESTTTDFAEIRYFRSKIDFARFLLMRSYVRAIMRD